MLTKLFRLLCKSIKEAGRIQRGEVKPTRIYNMDKQKENKQRKIVSPDITRKIGWTE